MSRPASYDFDYPSSMRSFSNRDGFDPYLHPAPPATPTSRSSGPPHDRRTSSQSPQAPSFFTPAMPRSAGSYDPSNEYMIGSGTDAWAAAPGPNRQTPAATSRTIQHLSFNHNNNARRPSSPPLHSRNNPVYHSPSLHDRDPLIYRQNHSSPPLPPNLTSSRSTLWWGELEPWMDEEYAKQVCGLMGWDPVNIKVPRVDDAAQQSNNPGYCYLTFPTPSHAASVLGQIASPVSGSPVPMPNSSKPFVLNWASSVPATPMTPTVFSPIGIMPATQQQFPKEFSIFVGDLAPETSNSDLVAVFRNPVLGLRNDREPKFIRPFLSCKSAKIMLDPVTGVSRGYGFVRFTEEADQQRALIEMHGLYCLSRPMRISPATAKFKQPSTIPGLDGQQLQYPSSDPQQQAITIALPLPSSTQPKSVSTPIAANSASAATASSSGSGTSLATSGSGTTMNGSNSTPSLSSGTGSSHSLSSSSFTAEDMLNLPHDVLAQIAQRYANGTANPPKSATTPTTPGLFGASDDGRYTITEESWKHHAQARAILGNLIGPNGEQLTSTDPYNTTVFVGGLSPLISEETLRTFFAPFGDIHYVKVPVGKHCGFVQFVKKADAERAIEKMQGFPVGGSRIRLSWGRSQYKAAQAAAQAAQAAAMQAQFQAPQPQPQQLAMTPEQALLFLQKFGFSSALDSSGPLHDANVTPNANASSGERSGSPFSSTSERLPKSGPSSADSDGAFDRSYSAIYSGRPNPPQIRTLSSFSPFSPDPNLYLTDPTHRDSLAYSRSDLLPHPSKSYAPGFGPSAPSQGQDAKVGPSSSSAVATKVSPTSTRPPSVTPARYGAYLDGSASSFQVNRAPGRPSIDTSTPGGSRPRSSSQRSAGDQEHDGIQDVNGTLASLNLDHQPHHHPAWKGTIDDREDSGDTSLSQ